MKIVFAGTPEFAAVALDALHKTGFDITLVLTQPDRPAGRGMHLQASAVKQWALAHQIPVAQPLSLRLDGKYPDIAQATHDLLRATPHDVMVVAAYGLILPPSILSIPRLGCLNIHGSLLPRWRGAAPIHRAIEHGDTETGITIMQMDAGLDTGAMLLKQSVPITTNDSTASLHDTLASLGGEMIVRALQLLEHNNLPATPQPEHGITYAAKISKDEAAIDFTFNAEVIARKIRAFNPFPGAHANLHSTPIKFWRAHVLTHILTQVPNAQTTPHTNYVSGQIVSTHHVDSSVKNKHHSHETIVIACDNGRSFLCVEELQKPGGKRLTTADFLSGFDLQAGQVFEGVH